MSAYYNEFDPKAAAWLRELIRRGLITPGDVDTRSILDVRPDDLRRYAQCHFFAGIGVWSYALRRAGWADDRPVWTGSCPCQPFSAAGKGAGFADERHLWPAFFHLIEQCDPDIVLGEQVASKDGLGWLDLVQTDMERSGYAFGAIDTCAAGFGAPHIRQRLYWVADANQRLGRQGRSLTGGRNHRSDALARTGSSGSLSVVELVDTQQQGLEGHAGHGSRGDEPGRLDTHPVGSVTAASGVGGMADTDGGHTGPERQQRSGQQRQQPQDCRIGHNVGTGPTNGFWRDADWLFCRDGKWRPVEPGTFPLAHGAPARVGRLRGYGNAINAEQAQGFIEAYLEAGAIDGRHLRLSDVSEMTNDSGIFA